jgi:hypothetical protein
VLPPALATDAREGSNRWRGWQLAGLHRGLAALLVSTALDHPWRVSREEPSNTLIA